MTEGRYAQSKTENPLWNENRLGRAHSHDDGFVLRAVFSGRSTERPLPVLLTYWPTQRPRLSKDVIPTPVKPWWRELPIRGRARLNLIKLGICLSLEMVPLATSACALTSAVGGPHPATSSLFAAI